MKFLAITMFCAAVIAFIMKIRLHFKLLEPQKRSIGELWRYFGINFLLPVFKKYTNGRLESRRLYANRLLVIFYSCALLSVLFFLM
ncbi:MAG: hypothetical protein ABUT20_28855 [Bacteroidota bacterium]